MRTHCLPFRHQSSRQGDLHGDFVDHVLGPDGHLRGSVDLQIVYQVMTSVCDIADPQNDS